MLHNLKIRYAVCLSASALLAPAAISAADGPFASLDPKAISIRLPADMQWKGSENITVLSGTWWVNTGRHYDPEPRIL